jgi:hypothetical protein
MLAIRYLSADNVSMANLEFYNLGSNPEEEALRTQQLYSDSGVDAFVRDEFESTVHAYANLPLPEIAQRLCSRYAGAHPAAHGILPVYKDIDLGMAIWGDKDFQSAETLEEIPGINVSAWILRQYRGQGFGRITIEYATAQALALSKESGRQVWTSIKPENLASRRSCEHAGFIEISTQPDKPDRLLYIVPTD